MADTVTKLSAKEVKMCVASGSPRDRVLLCLEKGGIESCFAPEAVFNREEVGDKALEGDKKERKKN